MSEVIGYEISASDNAAYFFADAPQTVRCAACSTVLDFSYRPSAIKLHRSKRYDISYTYDLRWLFSPKCMQLFADLGMLAGELATKVCDDPEYYFFWPSRVLPFDRTASRSRLGPPCPSCFWPKFLVGGSGSAVVRVTTIEQGIYRTDDLLGDGPHRTPLLIVDAATGEKLKKERLRGPCFHPVRGLAPHDPRIVQPGNIVRMEDRFA